MADPAPQLPGTMLVQDPLDSAFAAYKQALVDLNGDGIPDAPSIVTTRPPITNQERRGVQRRAMAGIGPSDQEQAALAMDMPRLEQNSDTLGQVGMTGASMLLPMGPVAKAIQYAPRTAGVLGSLLPGFATLNSDEAEAQSRGKAGPKQTPASPQQDESGMLAAIGDNAALKGIYQQIKDLEAKASAPIQGVNRDSADQIRNDAANRAAELRRQLNSELLKAQQSKLPFLQRYPEYSNIAPWVAAAGAAAIPGVGAVLSRRAATAPLRQQARAIDSAVNEFRSAPTPYNALAAAKTVEQPAAAQQGGMWNALANYGSLGVGASLPSAAVVAPYFIDYMQPANTEAHKQAGEQFTVDKLKERMTGPFALGMALAGGGKFLGEKAASAFINPAPRGSNLAQAQVLRDMAARSNGPEDVTTNLLSMIRGGQTSALENKRLQGALNAWEPNVVFNDVQIGTKPMRLPGPGGNGGPPGGPVPPVSGPGGGTKSLPPPDQAGPRGPSQELRQGSQPNQEPQIVPAQQNRRFALEGPRKLEIQEKLLSGASPEDLARQYGASKAVISNIQKNTDDLINSVGGDRAEALRQIQNYKKFRDFTYSAAPIGAGGAVNNLLNGYYGGQEPY